MLAAAAWLSLGWSFLLIAIKKENGHADFTRSPFLTRMYTALWFHHLLPLPQFDLRLELYIDMQGTKSTRNVLDIRALYGNSQG
jgi:hypothetical protein